MDKKQNRKRKFDWRSSCSLQKEQRETEENGLHEQRSESDFNILRRSTMRIPFLIGTAGDPIIRAEVTRANATFAPSLHIPSSILQMSPHCRRHYYTDSHAISRPTEKTFYPRYVITSTSGVYESPGFNRHSPSCNLPVVRIITKINVMATSQS